MLHRPKLILALLTTLNLLNYLDRYVLSAVLGPLQEELRLSGLAAGLLSTVFLIGYFATSPVFGGLADRGRADGSGVRKVLMAIGITVWSGATIASGLATDATSLLAARSIVGVGEASYATLAPTLIDDLAPAAGAARWMAIFSAATPVGSALGYIVGGAVTASNGWRSAFFVAGGPGFFLALLCLLIKEPRRRRRPAHVDIAHAASSLLRVPLYRGAALGYCFYTFAIGGFAYWAPKYLHVRYALEAGRASQLFGLVTVVGGAAGTVAGGWLADRFARKRLREQADARGTDEALARANMLLCAIGTALGAPLAAAAIGAATAPAFFAYALPCQIALFAVSGPINVALLRSASPGLRATAMAVAIFAIHALGDLWSPPAIGLVADHAPMQTAMYAVPLVFCAAAFVWGRTTRASGWLT
ncbi:MAG: MFS transporter [Polyangiaceae bacterium]